MLLLLMTVNHMPTPLRAWTSQPLGFTSAAEGFVFLSAFLAGLIYCRRAARIGEQGARLALMQRAGVVLRAHYITFALIFIVLGMWLAPQMPAFRNMVWPMVDRPALAAVLGGLLVYQPPVLDILPLYVFLLAITPICFWIVEKVGWRWTIAGSGLLWALSQRPPLKLKLMEWTNLGHPWDFGNFDQFAWQFLWVLGLALGAYYFRKPAGKPLIDYSRNSTKLVAALCAVPMVYFFLARHGFVFFNLDSWWWLLDKWRLGPLRMVSFALHLGFILTFATLLRPLAQKSVFTFLGQHSLPVFCSHIGLALLATGLFENYQLSDLWSYLLIAFAVLALYVAAGAAEVWALFFHCLREIRGRHSASV